MFNLKFYFHIASSILQVIFKKLIFVIFDGVSLNQNANVKIFSNLGLFLTE